MGRLGRRWKNRKRYTVRCDWCGVIKETARRDTKTCSDKCRSRLSVFIRRLGWAPDMPPGPFTATDAIDAEIERLIRQESRSRKEKAKCRA